MASKRGGDPQRREFEAAVAEVARQVARVVQQGAGALDDYLSQWSATDPQEWNRRKAITKHERAIEKYRNSLVTTQRRMRTLTVVSAGLGTSGVATAVLLQADGPGPGLLIGSLVTGLIALRQRRYLRTAQPPAAPELPPPPTPVLSPGAVGWAEAQRLSAVRRQLLALIPAVAAIHPDAGAELSAADRNAGPALIGLVQRLAILHQISTDLSDSHAAAAADAAAQEVRTRLSAGVANYEQLLAAAATMMAAPDLGQSSEQVLTPAIDALTAYAHGLSISAETFDSLDRGQ